MTKKTTNSFKVTPLGGLSQIGSNMVLFQGSNTNIIIDCGILFPFDSNLGINYLIPDLDYLNKTDIEALVITHGHEDHIGAIVHFVTKFPEVPVYATNFTAALIRKKFNENKISKKITIYNESSKLVFNEIVIDPVSVNHSIPETFGIFLTNKNTNEGIFYCSDFKIDDFSIYESPFNFEKLVSLRKGLSSFTLMPDSTNIISSTLETPSETMLIDNFKDIFSRDFKRIFLTTFSSNIWRVKSILQSAHDCGLKVVPYGRSFQSYIQIAIETEIITTEEAKVLQQPDQVKDFQKKQVVLLSGCQGDFRSALRRVGYGEDKRYKPTEEDVFVFSSKAIPGNEKNISILMNQISEFGSEIITPADLLIHVSGHPGRDDLKRLYSECNPDLIIPIHGESFFLKRHAEFAKDLGYKSDWLTNYQSITLNNKNYKISELDTEFMHSNIHGKGKTLPKESLKERRKIAEKGLIIVSQFKKDFSISTAGIPEHYEENGETFLTVDALRKRYSFITEKVFEIVKVELRREIVNLFGYKPEVIFHSFRHTK